MKKLSKICEALTFTTLLLFSSCEKIIENTPAQTACSIDQKNHLKAAKYQ